jgi:RNA polymerase sigma-70 factor, ECF subfamily
MEIAKIWLIIKIKQPIATCLLQKERMEAKSNVTQLLHQYRNGNRDALDTLFPLVYDELKRLAASRLREERSDHTLQPTALVHEAYLRLIDQHSNDWQNRAHFFGLAAEMMRRILVNHAIKRNADKRFGNQTRLALDEAISFAKESNINLISLDEALNELVTFDEMQAKIVELRFFTGLNIEETAEVLGVSESTVKREWRIAKAWLHQQLA